MTAVLLGFMVLFYSFQSLFTRLYSAHYKGPDSGQSTTAFNICFGAFIGLATLITGGFSFAPSWQTVLCGALNAGMLLLYNTAMIESGNRGSYSFLMIASLFGCIIVPLFVGAIFLGEQLTALQIAAIVLMLISFVVMNARTLSLKGSSGAYYFWCAMLFLSNGAFSTIMNLQQKAAASLGLGAQRTEMIAIVYLGMALAVLMMELVRGGKSRLLQGFPQLLHKGGFSSAGTAFDDGKSAHRGYIQNFTVITEKSLRSVSTRKKMSDILHTFSPYNQILICLLWSYYMQKFSPG